MYVVAEFVNANKKLNIKKGHYLRTRCQIINGMPGKDRVSSFMKRYNLSAENPSTLRRYQNFAVAEVICDDYSSISISEGIYGDCSTPSIPEVIYDDRSSINNHEGIYCGRFSLTISELIYDDLISSNNSKVIFSFGTL